MRLGFRNFQLFFISILVTIGLVIAKAVLHNFNLEIIDQASLHNSVIAGAFFVVGFLLSATIADYKESERIPSEFSSIVENMYEDAKSSHNKYSEFNIENFRKQLIEVAKSFRKDVRTKSHGARLEVHKLNISFLEMETAGVPPNFIVKLKTQQAQLARSLFRVNYIQNIRFIPSATILARSIVVTSVALLLLTETNNIYSGSLILAAISFILIYMMLLVQVISTPFHAAGKTQDDVSLFLVDQVIDYLQKDKIVNNK